MAKKIIGGVKKHGRGGKKSGEQKYRKGCRKNGLQEFLEKNVRVSWEFFFNQKLSPGCPSLDLFT